MNTRSKIKAFAALAFGLLLAGSTQAAGMSGSYLYKLILRDDWGFALSGAITADSADEIVTHNYALEVYDEGENPIDVTVCDAKTAETGYNCVLDVPVGGGEGSAAVGQQLTLVVRDPIFGGVKFRSSTILPPVGGPFGTSKSPIGIFGADKADEDSGWDSWLGEANFYADDPIGGPDDDPDEDGLANFEEYQLGTDPTPSGQLYLWNTPEFSLCTSGNGYTVKFNRDARHVYSIRVADVGTEANSEGEDLELFEEEGGSSYGRFLYDDSSWSASNTFWVEKPQGKNRILGFAVDGRLHGVIRTDISADTTNAYDGTEHTVDTNALVTAYGGVKYAMSQDGEYGPVPPTITDAGELTVWCQVNSSLCGRDGGIRFAAKAVVTNRCVTLTSGSESFTYDGEAHSNLTVTVGGAGFADGEGVTTNGFPTITEIGTAPNAFSYGLFPGTKPENYRITCVTGTLEVVARQIDPAVDPGANAAFDVTNLYDGATHTIDTSALAAAYAGLFGGETPTLEYALTSNGVYGAEAPEFADAVVTSLWFKVSTDHYADIVHPAAVVILPRALTLTSGTEQWSYDGQAHSNLTVTVTGDGFAAGEGVSTNGFPTITDIGKVTNVFSYAFNDGTKAENYTVTCQAGVLSVVNQAIDPSRDPDPVPPGVDPDDPAQRTDPNVRFSAYDYAGMYDGAAHTIDTNALVEAYTGLVDFVAVEYSDASNGYFSVGAPLFTDAVTTSFWYKVTSETFADIVKPCKVAITNRCVTLASGSESFTYDGEAHSNLTVTVGGAGFVDGEGVTTNGFATITDAGSLPNAFSFAFADGTRAENYRVACVTGLLTVVANPASFDDLTNMLARAMPPVKVQLDADIALPADAKLVIPAGKDVTFTGAGKFDVSATIPVWGEPTAVGEGLKPEDFARFDAKGVSKPVYADGTVRLVARGEAADFPWILDDVKGVTAWVDALLTNLAAVVIDDGLSAETNAIDLVALTNGIAVYGYEPARLPLDALVRICDGGEEAYVKPAGWTAADGSGTVSLATLGAALEAGVTKVVPSFSAEEIPDEVVERGVGADGETYMAVVKNILEATNDVRQVKAIYAEGLIDLATNLMTNVTLRVATVDVEPDVEEALNDAFIDASDDASGFKNLDFLDLSVFFGADRQDELDSPIAIRFPRPLEGAGAYGVARLHDGVAETLPEGAENAVDGEFFAIDLEANEIVVCVRRFSVYAIGSTDGFEMIDPSGTVTYPKLPKAKGVKQEFLKAKSTAKWTAKPFAGCVFAHWEWTNGTPAKAFAALSENERKQKSLSVKIGEGEKVRPTDLAAVWSRIDEDLIGEVTLTPSNLVTESKSYVTATVKGLHPGLKFNAKKLAITGVPTKYDTRTVTVSLKNASGYTFKRTFAVTVWPDLTITVAPAVDEVRTGVPVMLWCDATMGTVKGTGVYALGKDGTKKVSINATAAKGYVFAGWYLDPGFSEPAYDLVAAGKNKDYRQASQTITVTGPTYLFARFVAKTKKADPITHLRFNGAGYCGADASEFAEGETWYQGVALPTNGCRIAFGSASLPTVKVSGLPAGVKFDKTTCRFTGVPTACSTTKKPFFKVKVTVKNKSGATDVLVRDVYVDPLPKWAVGNFDGYHMECGETNGTFAATVGKTGKVSGKTKGGLASTSFSAKSFANVTFVGNALCYVADVTVSYKDPLTKKTVKQVDTLYLMEDEKTGLGTIGGGDEDGNGCVGVQRAWDRKTDTSIGFKAFPAFDTKALKTPLTLDNGLSLKFGANGKVTVGGKVNGVKASGTTYVLPVEWLGATETVPPPTDNLLAEVPVYVAPTKTTDGFCEVYDVRLTVGGKAKFVAVQLVN